MRRCRYRGSWDHHRAGDDLLFGLCRDDRGTGTGASDDRSDPAFAQFDAEHLAQRPDDPLVTQMLLMFQEDHRCLQARPERAAGFQTFGQLAAIEASAMRADDFVLLCFNHEGVKLRQFGNLPADDLLRPDASQIVMALLASLDLGLHRPIGMVDQFSDGSLMAKGRPVLLLCLVSRLIDLLIARRRLGRIPGIGRRLFEPFDLGFQLPILLF